MSEGPWIRFFPSDWLAGTRGLTAVETGVYITLIAMMYERGEPIANDIGRLARLCGTTTAAMKSALSALVDEGKISIVNGALWNDRVGVETEFRREKSNSAQKSAEMRWQKNEQKQSRPDANAMQSQSERNANQKPDTRIRDANASLKRECEREFHEQFWPAYPLKVGKPAALKAFIAARQRAGLEEIMAGVRRYAAERLGQDKRYTKQPQGWLNRDGWTDESIPPNATSPPSDRERMNATLDRIISGELDEPAPHNTIETSFERTDRRGTESVVQFPAIPARN